MLHQGLRLRWISPEKGYGLFASAFIPKGTLTFVNDDLDIILENNDPKITKEPYRSVIDKYAYTNSLGQKVICWDLGKYMNHCCESNSMTTGFGFDIALRDIPENEEVTTDYGVFTITHEMTMSCKNPACRKRLDIRLFDQLVPVWDQKIKEALQSFEKVPSP